MSKGAAGTGLQLAGMVLAIAATVVAPYIGVPVWFVVGIGGAISVAGGLVAAPGKVRTDKTPQAQLMNFRSSRQPVPLLYGELETGCNKTFYHVANPYLHMVCELGEGPIKGIKRADGSIYTTTGAELPSTNPPLVYLDRKLWTEYFSVDEHDVKTGLVYMEFYNGSATQGVCAALAAASGGKWDQTLRRTAYIYVRLAFDISAFKQEPDITAVVRGLLITDPVHTGTDWTDNPALISYDLMTRSSQRGGLGIAPARFDLPALNGAIDYCVSKGWTCNLPITENQAASDNLEQALACFRGAVIYSDGKFKFRFIDLNYETTVMDLTEADVVTDSLRISSDFGDRPNAVRATYLDSANNYKLNDYVFSDHVAIAAEGDYRERTADFLGLSAPGLVQKMCCYTLERARLRKTAVFTAGERAMALEPLDLVRLTHSRPGWTQKTLRVLAPTIGGNRTVGLALVDEAATLYDDTYNLIGHDYHDTTLLDPSADPPDVIGASLSEEVYSYRGRSFTRLLVTFSAPANYPWFDHVEVWVSTDGGTNYRHQFNASSSCSLDPVNEGVTYRVRLRTVNVFGTRQLEQSAVTLSHAVLGKTATPASLSSLTAVPAGDAVMLAANPVADPDVVGYEVRIGDSWAGGVFLAFNLDSRMMLSNIKPGTHTFWMAPLDNSGKYATTPVSATVTVFLPAGFTLANSWSWDFDAIGTYDNTTHVTHNAADALKCSHTSDVLTGTWTSPEYDLGSVKTVRCFGDFLTDFVDPSGSFASIWGTGLTFADVDPSAAKTFASLYSLTAAGILRAQLKWGTSTGSLNSSLDWFEILAAEISARYVQVVVTLTDPALDANLYLYELNMKAYTF